MAILICYNNHIIRVCPLRGLSRIILLSLTPFLLSPQPITPGFFIGLNFMELTQEKLKELLNYDHDTGVFTRITRASQNTHIGDIAGSKNRGGYLAIKIDGKKYSSHRLAWLYTYGSFPKVQIDHINGIRDDNRLFNLREATNMQNSQNQKTAQKSNKSTGLLGAYFNKKYNTYTSSIMYNGKVNHLGIFKNAQESHQAYLTAKRELHPFGTL